MSSETQESGIKYRSQRIKKPSNKHLLYETNFEEKIDSPKRKYHKKNKKKEKMKDKKSLKQKKSKINNVIISNANIKIENNQNIFICLDENFKKPDKISLKQKIGKSTHKKLLKTLSEIKNVKKPEKNDKLSKKIPKATVEKVIKYSKTSRTLQDLKAKVKKNELKLKRKRIFNPKEHEECKLKKIKICEELKELHETYGEKIERQDELKKGQNLWDFVLKEMNEFSEYIQKRRKYFIFISRKLTKLAQITYKNKENIFVSKRKEEERHLMKIADTCAKMVHRDFWRNINKMIRYNDQKQENDWKKRSQQEKLESLVSKQLKLSSKMADFLNSSSAKKIEDKKLENEVMEENNDELYDLAKEDDFAEQELVSANKSLIISLNKESNKQYSFDEIIFKEIDIVDQKHSLEEIAHLAETFKPMGCTLGSNDININQPFLLKNELREYQLIGMNWLVNLNQKRMNGILADEMGLGKTIQTIALLSYLAAEKGIWGPHLIIVPTSILVNWEIEFKRWCPAFKIMTYFGSPKERKMKRTGWSRINSFHVCITSYKIAIQDQKIFRRKKWYYMVLDEAQHIKNFKSQTWQILLYFQTRHRLLLTGTPLQNEVCELWSLMHFLMPSIFDSQSDFKEWFSIPMQQALQKNLPISLEIIKKLHSILRPFLLRRLKKDVEKQLPTKTEYLIKCQLSRRQRYLYDEFINKENKKNTARSEDFLGLMNILMQLRKVCNHPDLFEPRLIESPFVLVSLHYYISSLCRFNCFRGVRVIGWDSYLVCKDKIAYELSNELIKKDFEPIERLKEDVSYSKFYTKWLEKEKKEQNERVIRNLRVSSERIAFWRPLYDLDLLKFKEKLIDSRFYEGVDEKLYKMKYFLNEFVFTMEKAHTKSPKMVISRYQTDYNNEICALERVKPKLLDFLTKFQYISIRQKLCFPNKKIAIYDSGKLHKMMELLKKLKNESHKVLIFTQMSKMLDIFEFALNIYNFTYVRLDGSTKPDIRQKIVERFNNDPKIFCFVASTRSGGIGLNLTGADTVVFYDTDWNPAMDKQAQDRCHRIGQTKNVKIYRLISEFTVEENILLKSIQKRKLDSYIMEEGKFNTEYFVQNKVNVKDLLGNTQIGSLDAELDEINVTQYNTALEKIEDPEDALACKKAELEEKNYDIEEIDEFLKIDEQEVIEKEEDFLIDFENLPRIYKYGLNTLNILNPLTPGEDLHESVLIEKEEASEEEIKRDLEEKNEEKGKSYDKKQSLEIYLKSKWNLRNNNNNNV